MSDKKRKHGMDPLRQAIQLAALELERANKMFPEDERQAINEL